MRCPLTINQQFGVWVAVIVVGFVLNVVVLLSLVV